MTDNTAVADELRDSLRAFLVAECSSEKLRKMFSDPAAQQAFNQNLAELGWTAVAVPEAQGGMDLGLTELAMVYEELGRCLAPSPLLPTQLVVDALVRFGTSAMQDQYLPRIAVGELYASVSLPDRTPALDLTVEGEQVKIDGRAEFLLNGADAGLLLLAAHDGDGKLTWVLLDVTASNADIERRNTLDLTRHFATLSCDALTLPIASVLATGDSALALQNRLIDHAALALASESNGAAQTIFDKTIEYMKTRTQFDKPIGSFQALKHRVASLKVKMEAAKAATRAAVQHVVSDDDASKWASIAKFTACDTYEAVAYDAVQLHGGIGYTWEHDCHLFLKRAKLNQQLFGDTQWHRDRTATLLSF
ncbi:MAG: acyl-CoA dehydrogenase family protein [Spongiibacteraceae bacterium]